MDFRILAPNSASILRKAPLLAGISAWSFVKRFGNMGLERLLKLYRASCPARGMIARLCSVGYLARISQLHRDAGHFVLRIG